MDPLIEAETLGDLFYQHEFARLTTLEGPGWYFLGGLPGSVDIKTDAALYVKPTQRVLDALRPRMLGSQIGSFAACQSTYWHDRGRLPIWVTDFYGIAHVLLTTVKWSELDRFNNFAEIAT